MFACLERDGPAATRCPLILGPWADAPERVRLTFPPYPEHGFFRRGGAAKTGLAEGVLSHAGEEQETRYSPTRCPGGELTFERAKAAASADTANHTKLRDAKTARLGPGVRRAIKGQASGQVFSPVEQLTVRAGALDARAAAF